mmetsp:Transcript_27421/g.27653  ORF Transcript_27421/g.27653 Transcript_27421/m.27653 type:complete len:251 (+) Transcript_27421:93-845(+)
MHKSFPSFTLFCHSTVANIHDESTIDYNRWPDKDLRPHDPPITDFLLPVHTLDALLLELEIPDSLNRNCNISIVSSPHRCCIETAVLIAHALRIPAIQIHYGVADSCKSTRKSGYDPYKLGADYSSPMYLHEGQMQEVIYSVTEQLEVLVDIDIERVSGEPVRLDEDESVAPGRMVRALEEIKEGLKDPDDHIIVVTHRAVMSAASTQYGGGKDTTSIYDAAPCSFLCIAAAQDDTSWVFAKSRVHIAPR